MGQIMHSSNNGVFMFQILVAVVIFGFSETQYNVLTSSADYATLKQRVSALEADMIQVNTYIGSVGQLIKRYIEIERKFDKVLELKGEMQSMKHEIQLINQSSRLCQPEVTENMEEVTQAAPEVQSNVEELSEILHLKQGFEKMKIDMKSLKEDLKVRHAEDNITLTEMFAEGYSQLTENINELGFQCQQNYSALQQIHAVDVSNLQNNVSRLDHDLSTHLNHTETMNNRVSPARDKDCLALYRNGVRRDGVYEISPDSKTTFNVYCDMNSGGWTLIQKRIDDSLNFTRDRNEYVNGFNNSYGNFWLGLKYIHLLTSTPVDILFKVVTMDTNETALMQYSDFYIDGPENKYTMHINVTGRYNTVANNGGYTRLNGFGYHNGAPFSTFDRPDARNCVNTYGGGGWWYYKCWEFLLNNPFKKMNVRVGYPAGKVTRSEIKIKRAL